MPAAARPVGGVDYPRTYQEFTAWFSDDAGCREYLGNLRWPDGFICPECGCGGGWRTGQGLGMCAEGGKKTSVAAGTIFHRSHGRGASKSEMSGLTWGDGGHWPR